LISPQHTKKEHHVCQAKPSQAKPSQAKRFFRLLRHYAALCLLVVTLPAKADCLIHSMKVSNDVERVFKANGVVYKFKNHSVICNKLKKANAYVVIDGFSSVLAGMSIGLASIYVGDRNNHHVIIPYLGNKHIHVNSYASIDKARELLLYAINDALNEWGDDLDEALTSLESARQSIHKPAAQR